MINQTRCTIKLNSCPVSLLTQTIVVVQEMMAQIQPSQEGAPAVIVNANFLHVLHKMNETILQTQLFRNPMRMAMHDLETP